MTTRKQTIRARIAEEAIAKVMQFFDGTLAQTLHEILQNARRSGATPVTITHDRAGGRITVSDDGRGIGDPAALLAFGRSGWPQDLRGAEHPAGMGIFSLARRSPRIRSRVAGRATWCVQLGEDHFVGREPAAVAADPEWDRDHGTDVTLSVLPTDADWIPGVIADAVRHYPIPVSVNGRKAEQSDFMEDAVRTETWRGLRVGVFHSTSPTWATPGINFHGLHVAFPDLPHVHALPGADADAPRTWWTLANVIDCPDIELTLPTRTAIVQTPFTAELVSEATRIIYRAIAAAGRAPRLGYETRTRAAAAGITLPADPRHLTPWRPKNARDAKPLERPRHPDLQHAILVDDDELDAAEPQTLAWAARESDTLGRYWEIESGLRGYRWYDDLPCIIGVNVHVRRGTETHTSTRKTRRDGESPLPRGRRRDRDRAPREASRMRRARQGADTGERHAAQPGGRRDQRDRAHLRRPPRRADRQERPLQRAGGGVLPAIVRLRRRQHRHPDARVPAADRLPRDRAPRVPRGRSRRRPPRARGDLHPAVGRRRLEHRHRDPQRRPHGDPPDLTAPAA